MADLLSCKIQDRVALVTFERSDNLNAFNRQLRLEIIGVIKELDENPAVRVVVVTGEGGKSFSTGYDLKEAAQAEKKTVEGWSKYVRENHNFTESVWNCSKPVIAMIDGFCLAGALEFAQMCDLRYCSDDSQFGVVETRFSTGVTTMIMPWIVGARCREMIYTGDIVDSDEALRIGLVNRVFPKASLHDEVMKIANRMAQVSMQCLTWNKRSINGVAMAQGMNAAMEQGMHACTLMNASESPEYQQFDKIRRRDGIKTALKWRAEQFEEFE